MSLLCKHSSPEKGVRTECCFNPNTVPHTPCTLPHLSLTLSLFLSLSPSLCLSFSLSLFLFSVPNVPNITALARLSGKRGVLTWQPYTLDTSKGFLTNIEVYYQSVPVTSTGCPPSLDRSAKIVRVGTNESRYVFTELLAEEEYCVAVKAGTAVGNMTSNVHRLPCK